MIARAKRMLTGDGIRERALRGSAILTVATFGDRGLRLARGMILARLLVPEQFGIMAIVLLCNTLFQSFTSMGVSRSIIHNKRGGEAEFLNVAWWFSFIRGVALYAVGFFAAPLVATFYEEPLLTPLLRVAFISMLLAGAMSPGVHALRKELRMGGVAIVQYAPGGLGAMFAIAWAFGVQRDVWALVYGFTAEFAFRFVLSFIVRPIRPRLSIDRESLRDIFRYARGMVGLPLLAFAAQQADILVLGKMVSKEVLGLYSLSLTLATLPRLLFAKIFGPLVGPILARLQDDIIAFRAMLLRILTGMLAFAIPLAVTLALFAKPILTLAYGVDYAAMAVPFALLSLYVAFQLPGRVIAGAYMAIGEPGKHRNFAILRVALLAIGLYPAILYYGVVGAAATCLGTLVLVVLVQTFAIARRIELRGLAVLATARTGLLVGAAVATPAVVARSYFQQTDVIAVGLAGVLLAAGFAGSAWLSRELLRSARSGGSGGAAVPAADFEL